MFDDPKEASVSEKAHDAHSNEDSGAQLESASSFGLQIF